MDWKEYGRNVLLLALGVFVAFLEGIILLLVSGINAAWGDGSTSYFGPLGFAHVLLSFANGYAAIMLLKNPPKGRLFALGASISAIILAVLAQVLLGYNWVLFLFTVWWFAVGAYTIGTLWKPINQETHPRP